MVTVRNARGLTPEQAQAERDAAAKRMIVLGLRPDDTIRFPRTAGVSTTVEGHPIDIAPDGSVTCLAGGKFRAILPEKIEVRMRGPRGGIQWVPLVPQEET